MNKAKSKQKDKWTLTKEQAKEMVFIQKNGMVHTFYNNSMILIGADHSKESVFEDIDKSYRCARTGEQAQDMGHGLAVIPSKTCKQSDILFVETKDD